MVHSGLAGKNTLQILYEFLMLVRKWTFYGSTLFRVETCYDKVEILLDEIVQISNLFLASVLFELVPTPQLHTLIVVLLLYLLMLISFAAV